MLSKNIQRCKCFFACIGKTSGSTFTKDLKKCTVLLNVKYRDVTVLLDYFLEDFLGPFIGSE